MKEMGEYTFETNIILLTSLSWIFKYSVYSSTEQHKRANFLRLPYQAFFFPGWISGRLWRPTSASALPKRPR